MARFALTASLAIVVLHAAGISEDLANGALLTATQAAAIEAAAAQGKAPLPDRHRLLGWYAAHPEAQHRGKRVALILALAQRGELGRLSTHEAARIRRDENAGPLASPDGYAQVKAALLARAQKSKLPVDHSNAAWFVFFDEPDEAIRITAENGLERDTAVMAAQYLLGVVTPDARSSGFGRGLLQLVNETGEPLFQYAFGDTLRTIGARLYAEGKTEWDYTTLANQALARAAKAEPQQTSCGFTPAVLPTRGAASPPIKANPGLTSPPSPGEVTFYVLIGCSGYAASLEWLEGPAEAVGAAKREIATRHFDVPLAGGQPSQSLQLISAVGRRAR
jgi:hypothetical protein